MASSRRLQNRVPISSENARHCLFPSKHHNASNEDGPEVLTCEELQQAIKTMAGTVVTPVDALVRFHHYTAHFRMTTTLAG